MVFLSYIHISRLVDGMMCLILFRYRETNPSLLSESQIYSMKHILPPTRLFIWMYERNTIKLHAQVFLKMNTWMFETCRRHYN